MKSIRGYFMGNSFTITTDIVILNCFSFKVVCGPPRVAGAAAVGGGT